MDVGWEKETDEPTVTDVEVSKIGYGVSKICYGVCTCEPLLTYNTYTYY